MTGQVPLMPSDIPPDPTFPDPGDDLEGSRTFVLGVLAVIAVLVVLIVWCLVG